MRARAVAKRPGHGAAPEGAHGSGGHECAIDELTGRAVAAVLVADDGLHADTARPSHAALAPLHFLAMLCALRTRSLPRQLRQAPPTIPACRRG